MLKTIALTLIFVGINASAALTTGQPAPDFSLKGSDGKTYKLSEFKTQNGKPGKTVVLEWFNKDCPYVRKFYDSRTMQGLQKDAVAKGVVWFSIASSAPGKEGHLELAEAAKYRTDKGVANTAILLDGDGEVAKKYSAKTTPHMFIIDPDGKIAYQGAIDDKPSANPNSLKDAKNYVSTALAKLAKGEKPQENSTTPYGCSVKY